MMRIVVCTAILALLPATAAAGSKAANYLVAEEIAGACDGKKGRIDSAAVIERDLTGDGKADLIISHDGIKCADGSRSAACGMQVCTVRLYERRGELLKLTLDMLGAGVRVDASAIPKITMYAHGGRQGSIRWDGATFAPLSAEGKDKAGAADADEQPLSIVRRAYRDFFANNVDDIHAKKNRSRYFVPALARLYDADEVQACVSSIEVSGQEKPNAARIRKSLAIVEQSNDGNHAVIVARFRNGGSPESHRFEFVKQEGLWKVSDVVFDNGERFSHTQCETGRR